MTYEEALKRVTKLLKLANRADANEAAAATKQAQKIMRRYNIEAAAAQLEEQAPDEPVGEHPPLDVLGPKGSAWKSWLAGALAEANGCRVLLRQRRSATGVRYGRIQTEVAEQSITVIGRATDVRTVRYLYQLVSREIDRIAKRECKGLGRTYANNFRIGCVERIKERLDEARAEVRSELYQEATAASDGGLSLVRVDRSLAELDRRDAQTAAYIAANIDTKQARRRSARYDENARAHGREAADSINLNNTAGSLGAGHYRLRGRDS